MKLEKTIAQKQTSLEMNIAVAAILVMVLETLIGLKGVPLFFN